jgi:hypothetical protein
MRLQKSELPLERRDLPPWRYVPKEPAQKPDNPDDRPAQNEE